MKSIGIPGNGFPNRGRILKRPMKFVGTPGSQTGKRTSKIWMVTKFIGTRGNEFSGWGKIANTKNDLQSLKALW